MIALIWIFDVGHSKWRATEQQVDTSGRLKRPPSVDHNDAGEH
jgi:hypothetical protein